MKRLLLLALMAFPLILMAQKKQFTLDDLIPGGKTYRSMQPENRYYTWLAAIAVELDVDSCSTVNRQTGNKTLFLKRETVNEVLQAKGLKPIPNFYNVTFLNNRPNVMLTKVANERACINVSTGKLVWSVKLDPKAESEDMCDMTLAVAYTKGHNLYIHQADDKVLTITNDGSIDIRYGESVHRNEFGIEKGTFWSPDGSKLAFYRMDQSMVSKYPQVNITPHANSQMYAAHDTAEVASRCALLEPDPYPMAGETSHKVSVGVYDISTKQTIYLKTEDPTDRYFTNISWSPDAKKVYVIELNRDQNHAECIEYNATTGEKIRVLFTEDNEKYVEPCAPIQFLPWDATKFIYLSRRDGYNHIYLYNAKNGKPVSQITKGKFEVFEVLGFNLEGKGIVYTSNELDPLQKNPFIVSMSGERFSLGNKTGWHNVSLSPNGDYILDNYSSGTIFARHIDIVSTMNNTSVNAFTAKEKWNGYNVPKITVGKLKAADGVTDVYYRLILPTDFDETKKYPAVIYVYGGPHAHNIDASRNYGARGWDIWMAQKGYVMFCLDNRGSEHRGLAFEQATFRNLGVEEMKDQMKGVEYLKSLPYVDADRIGVHGWSFGGFMTSSLMTTYPETFKVGVAGGPVIDWRFYEVMYGERYMDTPESNPEGYENTSLLNKAKNLKGRLMVIYGGNDNTCVPQHTLSFMRACIDADTYPDLFTYPGDGHNMSGKDRIHLHNTITRYFEDHLK